MEKLIRPVLAAITIMLGLSACSSEISDAEVTTTYSQSSHEVSASEQESASNTELTEQEETSEEAVMILKIGDETVPVTWEDNQAAAELEGLAESGLMIDMSKYGGFEQVGSIGQDITSDDEQITTAPGDIVLYSGDQIVIFYGSNSWAYTRLGKIDLTEDEITELLSNEDVTITITMQ